MRDEINTWRVRYLTCDTIICFQPSSIMKEIPFFLKRQYLYALAGGVVVSIIFCRIWLVKTKNDSVVKSQFFFFIIIIEHNNSNSSLVQRVVYIDKHPCYITNSEITSLSTLQMMIDTVKKRRCSSYRCY